MPNKGKKIAIWAITPQGALLGASLTARINEVDFFVSAKIKTLSAPFIPFHSFVEAFAESFHAYNGHICIMSTGIVIRLLAPIIKHKTIDPAVVVIDDAGRYAISLLSGHLGGANKLAKQVADLIGAEPVITTATDSHNLPAIDMIAKQKKLVIENPAAIKHINMAILSGEKITVYDPFSIVKKELLNVNALRIEKEEIKKVKKDMPFVYIDDVIMDLPENTLILRPGSLVAGIGCNRNTALIEIKNFLNDSLNTFNLSVKSVSQIATIDLKKDEAGLLELSAYFQIPIQFFDKEELNSVKHIQMPSEMVRKHIGVKSVCEAAAILASNQGELIVNKQKKGNVTVALARMRFTLLE
jgi:cobalt-precorrin 5A hydrolase